ncbi:MAG: hypothetical protein ABIH42_02295 [Planctomycetota bacterium]
MRIIITCPHCKIKLSVDEKLHYKKVICPKCKQEFQVFTDDTVQLSTDFLKQMEDDEEDKS